MTADMLFGMQLIANPYLERTNPVMQLSKNIDLTEEFRHEYDSWLEEFFGREKTIFIIGNKIHTHPDNVAAIKMRSLKYGD